MFVRSNLKNLILVAIIAVTFGISFGIYVGVWLKQLPGVQSLEFYKPSVVTQIFDSQKEFIAEFYTERRIVIQRNEMPKNILQAILAAEDAHFYNHMGLDFSAILRAAFVDIKSMRIVQGASTITQQLAKLLFLTHERTFSRKLKEAIISVKIERHYSKDEILNLYLNQCYFGRGAYGVESAARTFFGLSVADLSVPQCALLAGLLPSPARHNPYNHPDRALKTRNAVLKRMEEAGYISDKELNEYIHVPIDVKSEIRSDQIAPYFIEEVRQQLVELVGNNRVLTGGLRVYTTLNKKHQLAAKSAAFDGLKAYKDRYNTDDAQIALVSLQVSTGQVTSLIGGENFSRSKFNRVIQAKRQSGSAIKPFIYLTALEKGYKPNDIIIDSPYVYEDSDTHKKWRPRNYSGKYNGPTTFRVALEKSINVVTAKILDDIGIDSALDTIRRAGIKSQLPPYPSMGLGSGEVRLIELANAYGTLASNGLHADPYMITEISDSSGELIQRIQPKITEVFDPRLCFQITRLLRGAVENGTCWRARRLDFPVAAKTGTTNNCTDAWFIGYTPSLVCGVWVGFDMKKSLGLNETGSRVAGPVFTDFMAQALSGENIEYFQIPDGLEEVSICRETGFLASPECPQPIYEVFREGQEPSEQCQVHQR